MDINFKLSVNRVMPHSKKGISIMIGYVLLISSAVFMGAIVYHWMSTYVPKEVLECDDGVSLSIEDFSCSVTELNLLLKNNGRFNIDGYFIRATNASLQETATIDISEYNSLGKDNGAVLFQGGSVLKPNNKTNYIFYLNTYPFNQINLVEIVPIQIQVIGNKKRLVGCSEAKIQETINCAF